MVGLRRRDGHGGGSETRAGQHLLLPACVTAGDCAIADAALANPSIGAAARALPRRAVGRT